MQIFPFSIRFIFNILFAQSVEQKIFCESVEQMSVSKYLPKHYRFIVYSAKLLVPTKLTLETNVSSQKKRKLDSNEISLSVQNQTRGLAHWIDSHTDYDFAVISQEAGAQNTSNCFRWCEDLRSPTHHGVQ